MTRAGRTLGGIAFALAAFGCSDVRRPDSTAVDRGPIYFGEVSDSADDAVVRVSVPSANLNCSGTLIAPNVVLTALHCITIQGRSSFTCDSQGNLSSSVNDGGVVKALVDPPDLVEIYTGVGVGSDAVAHGAKLFSSGAAVICKNDIGLVVTDTPVEAPYASVRFGRTTSPYEESMREVGYGETDLGDSGRHVKHDVFVKYAGEDGFGASSPFAAPNTLVVGPGPCHGDSGGPLRSEATGAVVGVYSILQTSSCGAPDATNVYTAVAPLETLVRKALDYAKQEPILESGPDTGEGGAAGQPGEGGSPSDAGAPGTPGGGTVGSGGSQGTGARGGTGATGARGGTGGTAPASGGSATDGTGASAATDAGGTDLGTGTGSRRDPSCSCRTAGGGGTPAGLGAGLVLALALVLRRRRR